MCSIMHKRVRWVRLVTVAALLAITIVLAGKLVKFVGQVQRDNQSQRQNFNWRSEYDRAVGTNAWSERHLAQ